MRRWFLYGQRGTILVFTLAVLSLLSVLAVSMASVQSLSRVESFSYAQQLQARLIAHMGFERAVAELKRNPFSGFKYQDVERETWNVETGDNTLLEEATRPSYFYTESPERRTWNVDLEELITKEPKLISIHDPRSTLNGLRVGISGFTSKSTFVSGGDNYSLKVSDLQGRIYLNDGLNSYGGNQSSVSQNLKRIISALANHPDVLGSDAELANELGKMIVNNRPLNGYRNSDEVLRILQNKYGLNKGKDLFRKLEPYVTTFAWVDKNVANPVPLSRVTYDMYPVAYYRKGDPGDVGVGPAVNVEIKNKPYLDMESAPEGYKSRVVTFRRGRGRNSDNEYIFSREPLRWFDVTSKQNNHNAIYGLDELFPQYIEVVHRAPVNINTAGEPVLTALLADVSGFFVIERRKYTPYSPSPRDIAVNTIAKFQDAEFDYAFNIPQKYETWEYVSHSYDNGGYYLFDGSYIKEDADEYGYLYRTVPITLGSNNNPDPATKTIDAVEVARHIIAARNNGSHGGVDYSQIPFAGRFKEWSQLHRFFDFLVESNLLKDNRNIYWNYLPSGASAAADSDWSVEGLMKYPAGGNDPYQQEYASYAIADALKANFNPNLHLNELNPDSNLAMKVDKTDLIVNSTEFCFTPMGYFAVESLGRIVRPVKDSRSEYSRSVDQQNKSTSLRLYESTGMDVFNTPVVEVSSSKIKAVVKVFDVYRESTQQHFSYGEISGKLGAEPTNSGTGLETGPSPISEKDIYYSNGNLGSFGPQQIDNYGGYTSVANEDIDGYKGYSQSEITDSRFEIGWGAEYEGYIQLSTLGGVELDSQEVFKSFDGDDKKTKRTTTPGGSPHWPTEDIAQYEGLHVHFQWDFKAHHHASASQLGDKYRDEVSAITLTSGSLIDKLDPALFDPGYRRIVEDEEAEFSDEYFEKRELRFDLSSYSKVERTRNFADDKKSLPGPYIADYEHRLSRSFRLPGTQKSGGNNPDNIGELPSLVTYAPTDLRIDGAYVERNSGISYWVDEGVSVFSYGGAASMWLKPSFNPEFTGKIRKLFSFDRWHRSNYNYRNPNMFSMLFMPAHSSPQLHDLRSTFHDPEYVGTRVTNIENKPTEVEADGKGIKNIRSSSLFTAIYMHQAGGSLDDWEYDEWARRGGADEIGSDSGEEEGSQSEEGEEDPRVLRPDLPADDEEVTLIPGIDRTHFIDIETYYNTPSLSRRALNAERRSNNLEFRNSQLKMGRWAHVTWSWLINYGLRYELKEGVGAGYTEVDFGPGSKKDEWVKLGGGGFSDKVGISDEGGGGGGQGGDTVNNIIVFTPNRSHEHILKVFVNGKIVENSIQLPDQYSDLFSAGGRRPTFSLHSFEDRAENIIDESLLGNGYWLANTFRIGESSYHGFSQFESPDPSFEMQMGWARNFSGDFTVDEFYLHGSSQESDEARRIELDNIENTLTGMYKKGRYYIPRGSGDSLYASGPVSLANNSNRGVAEENKIRLIGVSWTWYPEDYDVNDSMPIMYDYSQGVADRTALRQVKPSVAVSLAVYGGGNALKKRLPEDGFLENPGFSALKDSGDKGALEIEKDDTIKYLVAFNISGSNPESTVLLTTPYFDDMSIYYSTGVKILYYVVSH